MKNLLAAVLLITLLFSCRKNGVLCKEPPEVCERTVPGIAGNYKLTKFELVSFSTGQAQDVTATLTACELSGIYDLRIDRTANYTEMANCNGSGTGTWDLTDGGVLITSFWTRIRNTSIVSWDCTNLILITHFPSVLNNNRYTLTRQ
jgi:hypothetical protein